MTGPTLHDMALLAPELVLVGFSLALLLVARRLRNTPVPVVATVIAAVVASITAAFMPSAKAEMVGFS